MTNIQLYLAIGVPLIFNGLLFLVVIQRIHQLEMRFDNSFSIIIGKIMELDNRLSKVESKLGIA